MSNKTVRNGGHDRDRTCDPYHVKALAVAPALRSLEHLQLVSEHYVLTVTGASGPFLRLRGTSLGPVLCKL